MDIPFGQDLIDLEKLQGIKKPAQVRANLRPHVILQLTAEKQEHDPAALPSESEIEKALDNHQRKWRRWKKEQNFPEVGSLQIMIWGLGLKDQAELEAKCRFVREQREKVATTHSQAASATAGIQTAAGALTEEFVREQSGHYGLSLVRARHLAELRIAKIPSLAPESQEVVTKLATHLLDSAQRFDEWCSAIDGILEMKRTGAPTSAATSKDSSPQKSDPNDQ